jgi:complex iron-sulfur molybdoenzyme family reductase subunit gamma
MRKTAALLVLCTALAGAGEKILTAGRASSTAALEPDNGDWKSAAAISLALQRTPLLYATDALAALEIDSVEVQLLRGAGAAFLRLEWADKTRESYALEQARQKRQPEQLVEQTPATNRFSDAVAVMVPKSLPADSIFPSLQMGDQDHPVALYYFDGTRGAVVMEASGRGTTRRTAQSFPARSAYRNGRWVVTMQIPEVPPGMPLAVAVWNGSQQDRDGRKGFSVWYRTN